MRRQIILEIEEEGTENIVADIIGMMRDKVDMNCEFRISQKILPEKISEEKEIKIPVFFQNSCMRQQGKEMGKAICKEERGVMILFLAMSCGIQDIMQRNIGQLFHGRRIKVCGMNGSLYTRIC